MARSPELPHVETADRRLLGSDELQGSPRAQRLRLGNPVIAEAETANRVQAVADGTWKIAIQNLPSP